MDPVLVVEKFQAPVTEVGRGPLLRKQRRPNGDSPWVTYVMNAEISIMNTFITGQKQNF